MRSLWYLAAVLVLALVLPAALPAQRNAAATKAIVPTKVPVLVVGGMINEQRNPLDIFSKGQPTLREMIETLEKAATDPTVARVVVRFEDPNWGYAQAYEFHRAMLDFRRSGKPLYASFDVGGIGTYLPASAANTIAIPEVGGLDLYGMNFGLIFFRDLLGKIGVEADVVNTGRFKNAMEPFTHQEMTDGTREQMTALLEDLFGAVVQAVADGRRVKPEQARRILTEGPWTSPQALVIKAVDQLVTIEDLLDIIDEELKGDADFDWEYSARKKTAATPQSLFSLFSMGIQQKAATRPTAEPVIAVLYAIGPIVDGRLDKSNPFSTEQAVASEDFLELIDDVLTEEGLKGIVLRVDSPGGSAIASDRIWNRLRAISEGGTPVVVSQGNVAASGGYYLSMAGDYIFTEPTTITGSIGVVGGKFALGGLYEKIGVNRQDISIGPNTGLYSEVNKWTDAERKLLSGMIDQVYDEFTRKAADSRGMTQEEIKALGGGRVWSGTAAVQNKLADELGSLNDAIAKARALSQAPSAKVVEFPKERTFFQVLEELFAGDFSARAPSVRTGPAANLRHNPFFQAAGAFLAPRQTDHLLFLIGALHNRPGVVVMTPWVFDWN